MDQDFPLGGSVLTMRMRQLLEGLNRPGTADVGGAWAPSVDIVETPDEVVIVAELAGITREEVKVIVDGDIVRIYGRRDPTVKLPGIRYHRMEIESGEFVRSFRIGVPFDASAVEAKTSKGFLRITLPKLEARKRKIEVEAV
jgi:HSP20 family protein